GKPDNGYKQVKRPYCPFRNFCVFLNGEAPETILAERDYLRERVDTFEFGMDFTNRQVKKLLERIRELEDTNTQLNSDLTEARQALFNRYPKKEPPENPKERGAPVGHPGWFRGNPEQIDKTVDVYLDVCPFCGSEDISPCNHTTEHIQEDIEEGKLIATCFVHCYYWCPGCQRVVHGWGENEIPNVFIGPDAKAKTSFMRHEVKASYNGTRLALQCFGNLKLTPGTLVGFDNHISKHGKPLHEALKQSLPGYSYMHADETGWKQDWLWIFTNRQIVFFHIDESRGSKVVIDHLGEFYNGILITDFWNAYRNLIGAFAKQKCLRHILGDIKKLLDKGLPNHPNAEAFLEDVKELFKDAIFLYNQHAVLTPDEYRSAKKNIFKRFKKLRSHTELEHHEADNIRKRLINFKDELFVFLKYPEIVEPTNNFAERGIRPGVLFRKITFGNRTTQGKVNVAFAMTIIKTAMLRALDPIEILRSIITKGVTSDLLRLFQLPENMPQAP
ncbi:MAG: IS66 family transposase, partial [Victivallaceae bacterium]